MKKIYVVFVLTLLIATMFVASSSVLAAKGGGGGGKPPKDDPDPTPADPAIAYHGGDRDNVGLWVMDADGSHQTYVPTPGLGVYSHSWSPDRTSIAFACAVVNEPDLYLWSIDITVDEDGHVQGSNAQLLTDGIGNANIVWSPNGDMIAFFKTQNTVNGRSYSIWLYHMDDSTTEKIYTDPDDISIAGELSSLTWDPTGTKLAFMKNTRIIDSIWYSPEIRTVDIITKNVDTVYTFPEIALPSFVGGGLDWANNDDKLTFNYAIWNNYNIAIYDISENSITTLSGTYLGASPSWSPDDSKIVYSIYEQTKGKRTKDYINTIDVSTQDIVRLGEGMRPDWCIA